MHPLLQGRRNSRHHPAPAENHPRKRELQRQGRRLQLRRFPGRTHPECSLQAGRRHHRRLRKDLQRGQRHRSRRLHGRRPPQGHLPAQGLLARARELHHRNHQEGHQDYRPRPQRLLLCHPDPEADPAGGQLCRQGLRRQVGRSVRHHFRRAALRLQGHAHGPLPPFLECGRDKEVHRRDGPLQAQPPALASHRRPGLAHRDQEVSRTHRDRRLPQRHHDRQGLQQQRRHPLRRFLHPGADKGSGGLRLGEGHHCHPRNRPSRPHGGGAHHLPAAGLHRRAL